MPAIQRQNDPDEGGQPGRCLNTKCKDYRPIASRRPNAQQCGIEFHMSVLLPARAPSGRLCYFYAAVIARCIVFVDTSNSINSMCDCVTAGHVVNPPFSFFRLCCLRAACLMSGEMRGGYVGRGGREEVEHFFGSSPSEGFPPPYYVCLFGLRNRVTRWRGPCRLPVTAEVQADHVCRKKRGKCLSVRPPSSVPQCCGWQSCYFVQTSIDETASEQIHYSGLGELMLSNQRPAKSKLL